MEVETLYDVSPRTRLKIIARLNLKCSNCGWNEASCDIHHIVPQSKGGTNDHTNLTNLCPNCHRLAHSNKLSKFVSIEEQIGDTWKSHYYPTKAKREGFDKTFQVEKRKMKEKQLLEKQQKIDLIKKQLLESGIDFSKFGWVEKASKIIGISTQKVGTWMFNHNRDFFQTQCFRRKKTEK